MHVRIQKINGWGWVPGKLCCTMGGGIRNIFSISLLCEFNRFQFSRRRADPPPPTHSRLCTWSLLRNDLYLWPVDQMLIQTITQKEPSTIVLHVYIRLSQYQHVIIKVLFRFAVYKYSMILGRNPTIILCWNYMLVF